MMRRAAALSLRAKATASMLVTAQHMLTETRSAGARWTAAHWAPATARNVNTCEVEQGSAPLIAAHFHEASSAHIGGIVYAQRAWAQSCQVCS